MKQITVAPKTRSCQHFWSGFIDFLNQNHLPTVEFWSMGFKYQSPQEGILTLFRNALCSECGRPHDDRLAELSDQFHEEFSMLKYKELRVTWMRINMHINELNKNSDADLTARHTFNSGS